MGNPCQFGWQNMTPAGKGRHCSQCDKTVVDFTVMTDEQVINYLLQHKNICGHFNKSQLGRTMAVNIYKTKVKKYWPAIAAMLIAGAFQLSPVYSQNSTTPSVTTGYKIQVEQEPQSNTNDKITLENDSTIVVKIKVMDAKTKQLISGASIDIDGIGQYNSDKHGYFKLSICAKQLPKIIHINAWASNYYYYTADIEMSDLIKNSIFNLEVWFDDPNMHVDGGDIDIKEDK